MNNYILALLATLFLISCEKQIDYSLEGELPEKPEFSVEVSPENPNKFVVKDLSVGNFTRVWSFPGGMPENSSLPIDTVFYAKKGSYKITLHVSSNEGNGNSFTTKEVNVIDDALGCQLPFLTENCETKCWRLSGEPGGVQVGPVPYSGEWFTSAGIEPTQANDMWCFDDEGNFVYDNAGGSFSSCQGYIDDPDYAIPSDNRYIYSPGAGFDGLDLFQFEKEIFMGVEDSGPEYNIISVTETEMQILTPIKPCDGAPSNGWFTLTFYPVE